MCVAQPQILAACAAGLILSNNGRCVPQVEFQILQMEQFVQSAVQLFAIAFILQVYLCNKSNVGEEDVWTRTFQPAAFWEDWIQSDFLPAAPSS